MFSPALVAASLQPIVLSILGDGEAYGYEIMHRVEELSDGQMLWTAGTLYPLMHRLESKGLIRAIWRPSDSGPRRKYYRITQKGNEALEWEQRQWLDLHAMLMKMWGDKLGDSHVFAPAV
jgi:PadR family transcriptional regulator